MFDGQVTRLASSPAFAPFLSKTGIEALRRQVCCAWSIAHALCRQLTTMDEIELNYTTLPTPADVFGALSDPAQLNEPLLELWQRGLFALCDFVDPRLTDLRCALAWQKAHSAQMRGFVALLERQLLTLDDFRESFGEAGVRFDAASCLLEGDSAAELLLSGVISTERLLRLPSKLVTILIRDAGARLLKAKLLTVEHAMALQLPALRLLASHDGRRCLQRKLLTVQQVMELPSLTHLRLLMTAQGQSALAAGTITAEAAAALDTATLQCQLTDKGDVVVCTTCLTFVVQRFCRRCCNLWAATVRAARVCFALVYRPRCCVSSRDIHPATVLHRRMQCSGNSARLTGSTRRLLPFALG